MNVAKTNKDYPDPLDVRYKHDLTHINDIMEPYSDEVIFCAFGTDLPMFHMTDDHLYDIFQHAPRHGLGWRGLTRDYNQMEGTFGDYLCVWVVIPDLDEWIEDLLYYQHFTFSFEETTRPAYYALLDWLGAAKKSVCKEVLCCRR